MAGSDRITLNFGANTSDVERGTDRIADSLEDTERKLDDVGQAGEKAGEEAAEGLDAAGDSASSVGDKLGDLGGIASDVLEGDLAGGASGAVDALSGLAAFIPGVGALIGSGLATVAKGFIDSWSAAAKANEDRINAMYEDFTQSGKDFLSTEAINNEISAIIQDAGRLQTARDDAAATGARLSLVLRAQAGDQLAASSVQQIAATTLAELTAKQEEYIATNGDVNAALDEQIGGLEQIVGFYGNYSDQTDAASEKARLFREATEGAGTAVGSLKDEMATVPNSIFASVNLDVEPAKKKLSNLTNTKYFADVTVNIKDRLGKHIS